MGRASRAFTYALAIPAGVIEAANFGNGAYGVERRQGNIGLNPVLSFDRIGNLTTCDPTTIQWFYAGPPVSMSLAVTNVGVTQVSLPSTTTTSPTPSTSTTSPIENRQLRADVVDMEITSSVNPASMTFRWPSVNITSGSYRLRASIKAQNFVQTSDVFHVLRGPNTACLPGPPVSSPSSSGNTAEPTSSGVPGTGSSPSEADGSSSKSITTPIIVGIVLASLALILFAIGVYFFIRNRKQRRQMGPPKHGGKKWNALNSTDSRAHMMGANATNDQSARSRRLSSAQAQRRNYSQSSSIGPTEETVVGGGLSEEKLGDYYSRKTNSVASYDDAQAMALASLPSLPHRQQQPAYTDHIRRNKGSYPDPIVAANIARRRSTDAKTRTSPYLPTIDSTTPTATVSPTSSFATPSELMHATTASPDLVSPSSPSAGQHDAKRNNRQSFGRKRKPVPAYDSSTPASPIPPSPIASEAHLSHSTASPNSSAEMEMGYLSHHSQANQQTSTTTGHYSTRAQLSRPGTSDSGDLLHKTSFGMDGKPVHYLMPDLPVDAQMLGGNSASSRR